MALDDLFCRCGSLIPDTEQRKLLADAETMRVRRERSLAIGIMPRAPELHLQAHRWLNASKQADGAGAPEADAKHAPVAREASPEGTTDFQPTKVQWVHQIYGVYGDKRPMSHMFQESQAAWQACADKMGAKYHLWTPCQLETLMRTRYSQFWDMYVNVRYPVMRVDIGRIVILHAYGGLYADLDTLPTRDWYAQAPLAVCTVMAPIGGGHTASDWREENGETGPAPRRERWDMEVLVGALGDPLFLRWLAYIRQEIASKPYREAASFWHDAKVRYVLHTTGPHAMERFLKANENKDVRSRLKFLRSNWFKDVMKLTDGDRETFDVLSQESNSYFTKEVEIRVPVGQENVAIPPLPMRFRTIGKNPCLRLAQRSPAPVEDAGRGDDMRHVAALKSIFQERHRDSMWYHVVLRELEPDLRAWLLEDEAESFEMIQEEMMTNWFNNDADGQTGGSPTDRPAAAPIASRQPTPRSGGCMEDWSSCDQMEAQPPPAAAERERTRSPGTAGTRPLRVLPS